MGYRIKPSKKRGMKFSTYFKHRHITVMDYLRSKGIKPSQYLNIILGRDEYELPKKKMTFKGVGDLFEERLVKEGKQTVIVEVVNINTGKSHYRIYPKQTYKTRIYMPVQQEFAYLTATDYDTKAEALKGFKQLEKARL
jgi:hypothetical protein